jgi:hypothetical protein
MLLAKRGNVNAGGGVSARESFQRFQFEVSA